MIVSSVSFPLLSGNPHGKWLACDSKTVARKTKREYEIGNMSQGWREGGGGGRGLGIGSALLEKRKVSNTVKVWRRLPIGKNKTSKCVYNSFALPIYMHANLKICGCCQMLVFKKVNTEVTCLGVIWDTFLLKIFVKLFGKHPRQKHLQWGCTPLWTFSLQFSKKSLNSFSVEHRSMISYDFLLAITVFRTLANI